MTNVWEHAGDELESSLSVLPFNSKAVMLLSSRAYSDGSVDMLGIQRGLQKYIDLAKVANKVWKKRSQRKKRKNPHFRHFR